MRVYYENPINKGMIFSYIPIYFLRRQKYKIMQNARYSLVWSGA